MSLRCCMNWLTERRSGKSIKALRPRNNIVTNIIQGKKIEATNIPTHIALKMKTIKAGMMMDKLR